MGRTRRISVSAKPTSVRLTPEQRLALRKLQTKRLEEGRSEPLLNEVFLEGFEKVLREEGWSASELGRIFPKQEPTKTRGKIQIFPKKRR